MMCFVFLKTTFRSERLSLFYRPKGQKGNITKYFLLCFDVCQTRLAILLVFCPNLTSNSQIFFFDDEMMCSSEGWRENSREERKLKEKMQFIYISRLLRMQSRQNLKEEMKEILPKKNKISPE